MPDPREIIAALLEQRTPVTFQAFGSSMHPTIRDGEGVAIHPLPVGAIRRGSVILYRIYGRLVLHRIVFNEKRTNRVFAVGDASVTGGDWVATADILGVALHVRRGERTHRLDTRLSCGAGLLRFALRPLRRALWNFRRTHHAQTPERWNS